MRRAILAVAAMLLAVGVPASAQDASKGEAVFKRCRACHAIGPAAKNKAGPALTGIVGKKAASIPGFNYSDAMKEAAGRGLTWTEPELTKFLEVARRGHPQQRHGLSRHQEPGGPQRPRRLPEAAQVAALPTAEAEHL